MKLFRNIALILVIFLAVTTISLCLIYKNQIKPVNNSNDENIEVVINQGATSKNIALELEKKELIRSASFFVFYLKLHQINDLKASTYQLSQNMSLEEIIETLQKGNSYNPDEISITFKEGINMKKIAKVISNSTENSYDDVLKKVKDEEYINSLIQKYWFLTDEIKNKDIYYPLEGYLFPDTYKFRNKQVAIEEIIEKMLNKMDSVLTPYKKEIENADFTVHEFLTLASVVELEGVTNESRKDIASVFYNRLKINMSLGSDVTTYYAFQVDMSERDLLASELNTYNPYNTRGPQMEGKLPIGPIATVGISSINASITPSKTDYLYFVADKNKKVYFTKTYQEHTQKVAEIKQNGDWIEW